LLDKNLTAESDASDTANYHLVIRSQSNSNTSKVGIAFKNTSDSTAVGAAILHHRIGGGSVGQLAFYTSPSNGTIAERVRISSTGTLLHGSGSIATQKATYGGLDVSCNNLSFVFGADSNSGNNTQARTNNAPKDSRIGSVHYSNSEEPVGVIRAYSDSTTNQMHWGGGSSILNAATQMSFYTAANNTTTNGTERLRIHSGGTVNIPSGLTLGQTIGSTASSNTLDDYEEGTFTPTQPTTGFNSASGNYTKIGRYVYANIFCTLPTNSSSVAFYIDSLPFTALDNSGTNIHGGYAIYSTYGSPFTVRVHDNGTRAQVSAIGGNNINLSGLDNLNFRLQVHYMTN